MAAIDEKEYTQSFDWKHLEAAGAVPAALSGRLRVHAGVQRHHALLVDVVLPLFQKLRHPDILSKQNTLTGLLPYALAYLAVILVQALSVVIFARNSMHIEMNLGRDMRGSLFHHLQTLSFSFYNVTPVGYLLTRVMSDTNRIASMLAWNFTDILWAVFYVLGDLCGHAGSELEAGAGGHRHRSGDGRSDGVLPEPHPPLEPEGT